MLSSRLKLKAQNLRLKIETSNAEGATVAEHFYPYAPVRPTGRLRKQVPGSPVRCFNKRICVDADSPVTNQTGFSGRQPLKLFRLSERTFGRTSTTPRRTCRKNCVLCALYCVLCTECCAVCWLLCTGYHLHSWKLWTTA